MRIAHIFVHAATNLGDIYLKQATREAIATAFPDASFTDVEARQIFTEGDIADLNAHDLVLIGGGGLLLRDTFPNDASDWQWGCSVDLLETIDVPIVVYAIGYNRFRGQEEFNRPLFDRHIELLVEKSAFFSVRNSGSAAALGRYVSPDLRDRIHINHCPSILFPRVVPQRAIGSSKIGLLLAGDRLALRHADRIGFLAQITEMSKEIARHSELHIVAHQPQDLWYLEHLKDIPFKLVDLIGKPPAEAIALYSNLDVMIGDRGHAQMIPFGLGCRIISLVSHDKLAWFLEDVGIEDHGVEESDPQLTDKVLSLVFPATGDTYSERRIEALRVMSSASYANLARLPDLVRSPRKVRSPLREVELCPV